MAVRELTGQADPAARVRTQLFQFARRVSTGPAAIVATGLLTTLVVKGGLDLAGGGYKISVLIPLAAAAASALVVLAIVRFEAFVLLALVARASLDTVGNRTAGALDPSAALAILLIGASAVWLAVQGRGARTRRMSEVSRATWFFAAAGLLSVTSSAKPIATMIEFLRITAVAMMLPVIERLVTDRRRLRLLLAAVYVSAIVPMVVGAAQGIGGKGLFTSGGYSRVRGTFLHPNPFANYLMFLLIMGVALLPHVRRRGWAFVGLGFLAGFLLVTYSRGAWIGLVVGVLVVGALQDRRIIVAGVVCLAALLVLAPSVSGRFTDLGETKHLNGTAGNSLIWRFEYWSEALPLANRNPITGIGLKQAEENLDAGKAVHNDFLRAYVETGLVGLCAYLYLLVVMLRTARRAVARAAKGFDRGVAVGFAGCMAAFITISITSNVISQVVILWYFVAFAAGAFAVARSATRHGVSAR